MSPLTICAGRRTTDSGDGKRPLAGRPAQTLRASPPPHARVLVAEPVRADSGARRPGDRNT